MKESSNEFSDGYREATDKATSLYNMARKYLTGKHIESSLLDVMVVDVHASRYRARYPYLCHLPEPPVRDWTPQQPIKSSDKVETQVVETVVSQATETARIALQPQLHTQHTGGTGVNVDEESYVFGMDEVEEWEKEEEEQSNPLQVDQYSH